MLKHLSWFFMGAFLVSTPLLASVQQVPETFRVREVHEGDACIFEIESTNQKFARVHRVDDSRFPRYVLVRMNERPVLYAAYRPSTFGAAFDIVSRDGKAYGTVSQKKSLFNVFEICTDQGHKLATCHLNLFKTEFVIRDPRTGERLARMKRPLIRFFSNIWETEVYRKECFMYGFLTLDYLWILSGIQADIDTWSNCHPVKSLKQPLLKKIHEAAVYFDGIEPNQEDYETILAYANELEEAFNENAEDKVLEELVHILDNESFSIEQRAALAKMLKEL